MKKTHITITENLCNYLEATTPAEQGEAAARQDVRKSKITPLDSKSNKSSKAIFRIVENEKSKEERTGKNDVKTDYYVIALESGEIIVEKDTVQECLKETLRVELKQPQYITSIFEVEKASK